MKLNKKLVMGGLAFAVLLMVGCGNSGGNSSTDATSSASAKESASKESTSSEVTIVDSDGVSVKVKQNPENVVVFDMGSLDTIQALDCGDSVVGTAVDNLPEYLAEFSDVESAGGIKEPDLEKINAIKPDLIIISGRQSDSRDDLEAIAPTLYLAVDDEKPWESTKENIKKIAQIYGKEEEADKKIATLDKEISELKTTAKDSGKKGLVVLLNEGELSAYGSGSRFGIIHTDFGVAQADDAIEASTHGQSVSYEYVLEKNPDILFVVDRTKAIGGDETNNNIQENELVLQTNAGKDGKVIILQPDVWYLSGGGITSTQLMIDDVKSAF